MRTQGFLPKPPMSLVLRYQTSRQFSRTFQFRFAHYTYRTSFPWCLTDSLDEPLPQEFR